MSHKISCQNPGVIFVTAKRRSPKSLRNAVVIARVRAITVAIAKVTVMDQGVIRHSQEIKRDQAIRKLPKKDRSKKMLTVKLTKQAITKTKLILKNVASPTGLKRTSTTIKGWLGEEQLVQIAVPNEVKLAA